MSNFLGSGDPKISFTWDSELKIFNPDSERIQFIPKFNIEEKRVHKSDLNGETTKTHLGFYHEAEIYYHSLAPTEYEDILRYLEVVDLLTLQPFSDNQDFIIDMIIDKARPLESDNFGNNPTSFYLKLKSVEYSELIPKEIITFQTSVGWLIGDLT